AGVHRIEPPVHAEDWRLIAVGRRIPYQVPAVSIVTSLYASVGENVSGDHACVDRPGSSPPSAIAPCSVDKAGRSTRSSFPTGLTLLAEPKKTGRNSLHPQNTKVAVRRTNC